MSSLLQDHSLRSIAAYLKSDVCDQRVFVLCGAGISTSAGIPDFRSPTTGLYANLAKLNLPYPEAVFDISYFEHNPQPFYTLARDIAPGRFIPTPTHIFIRLLHQHGKLHTCFTQNIDTLERKAGIPSDKVIEAHGSFASSRCIECKTPYDNDKMVEHISQARVPKCSEPDCGGLVKPDIVFFGESLPPEFITAVPALRSAALVIIMGTSLKVQPFAMLPNLVPRTECPRLLLNLDPAGTIGIRIVRPPRRTVRAAEEGGAPSRSDSDAEEAGPVDEEDEWEEDTEEEEEESWVDDVVHLGTCDASVRELCDLLGWREELEQIWKEVGGGGGDPVGAVPESKQEAIATVIVTAGDSGVIGESLESLETVLPPTGAKPISPNGYEEGVTGVQHVKDNSVEKTMDRIVLDLEAALNISSNTTLEPEHQHQDEKGIPNASLDGLGKNDLAPSTSGDLGA